MQIGTNRRDPHSGDPQIGAPSFWVRPDRAGVFHVKVHASLRNLVKTSFVTETSREFAGCPKFVLMFRPLTSEATFVTAIGKMMIPQQPTGSRDQQVRELSLLLSWELLSGVRAPVDGLGSCMCLLAKC